MKDFLYSLAEKKLLTNVSEQKKYCIAKKRPDISVGSNLSLWVDLDR
jgi:hypothetical protein